MTCRKPFQARNSPELLKSLNNNARNELSLPTLFPPGEQGLRRLTEHWYRTRDSDVCARALYRRHYSCYHYRDGRQPVLFCGPGEKTVLIDAAGTALFVWRKFIDASGQQGVNCAVFRNESSVLSSTLILEAMEVAGRRWPGERMYTHVNAGAVKSSNPGFCFKMAGWRSCGRTKGGLVILERTAES